MTRFSEDDAGRGVFFDDERRLAATALVVGRQRGVLSLHADLRSRREPLGQRLRFDESRFLAQPLERRAILLLGDYKFFLARFFGGFLTDKR